MNAKERFLKLKKSWIDASGNISLREEIDTEIDAFFDSLTEEQKKEVIEAVDDDFKAIHSEIADIKRTVNIRNILAPALPFLSVSYLAKTYYKKTPQWFYQRLNGNKINGIPVSFTEDELKTLSFALKDIGNKIMDIVRLIA